MVIRWRRPIRTKQSRRSRVGKRGRNRRIVTSFSQDGRALRHFSSPILFQQGRGLGGVLSGIFKSVIPFLKRPFIRKGLTRIGKSAAMAGLEALSKSMDDKNENRPTFKQALRTSARAETGRLAGDTLKDIRGHTPVQRVASIKASSARVPRRRVVPYRIQRGRGRSTTRKRHLSRKRHSRKRVNSDIFARRF